MMRLTEGTVLVQDGEPRASQLDQEVVLLSLRRRHFRSEPCRDGDLEFARRAASGRRDLRGAVATLRSDAATLSADVIPFLETLVRRNLLRVVGARERR